MQENEDLEQNNESQKDSQESQASANLDESNRQQAKGATTLESEQSAQETDMSGKRSNPIKEAQKRRELKKAKKTTMKTLRKNPYRKNQIILRKAENQAKENPQLRSNLKNFKDKVRQREQLGPKIREANDIEQLNESKNELEKEDNKLQNMSQPIKLMMFLEDMKNVFSGPKGWVKGCKGCFSNYCIMLCVIGSGVLTGILALTGVF